MADAEDLKSSGPKGRAGSSPALGICSQQLTGDAQFRFYPRTSFCVHFVSTFSAFRLAISIVRRLASSVACVYRSVVLTDLWPITSLIAGSGAPPSAALVPNV